MAFVLAHFRPLDRAEVIKIAREYTRREEPLVDLSKLTQDVQWIEERHFWVVQYRHAGVDPSRDDDPYKGLPHDDCLLVNFDRRIQPLVGLVEGVTDEKTGTRRLKFSNSYPGDLFEGVH
jgi:hypothetical protein